MISKVGENNKVINPIEYLNLQKIFMSHCTDPKKLDKKYY